MIDMLGKKYHCCLPFGMLLPYIYEMLPCELTCTNGCIYNTYILPLLMSVDLFTQCCQRNHHFLKYRFLDISLKEMIAFCDFLTCLFCKSSLFRRHAEHAFFFPKIYAARDQLLRYL